MEQEQEDNTGKTKFVKESPAVYASREALEEARLREAINRTANEKFRFLMTLMKINKQMQKAIIHHKS
jgi:hypothetical protein